MNTNVNLRQTKMDLKVVLQVLETIVNFILKDYRQHECKRKILEPSWTPSTTLLCLRSTGPMAFIVLWYHLMLTQGKDFLKLTQYVLLAVVGPDPKSRVPAPTQSAAPCQPWEIVSAFSYRLLGVSLERPMHLCNISMWKYLFFWKF